MPDKKTIDIEELPFDITINFDRICKWIDEVGGADKAKEKMKTFIEQLFDVIEEDR